MATVHLLGANTAIDTLKKVVTENQIVVFHGAGAFETRYVVHRVELQRYGYTYHLTLLSFCNYD